MLDCRNQIAVGIVTELDVAVDESTVDVSIAIADVTLVVAATEAAASAPGANSACNTAEPR